MKPKTAIIIIFGLAIGMSFTTIMTEGFREVNFETADGGKIFANLYGQGDQAVVLAHGAVFNKESWDSFARLLSSKGFLVLAIDFRGYGKSVAGKRGRVLYEDVLAAIRYLHRQGARKVSIIGASMGGGAAAKAACEAKKEEIEKLILLSPVPIQTPELMKGNKLFIASKGERLMPKIKEQYERSPKPRKLVLLEGNAHAQHIFETQQAEKLTNTILSFLSNNSK